MTVTSQQKQPGTYQQMFYNGPTVTAAVLLSESEGFPRASCRVDYQPPRLHVGRRLPRRRAELLAKCSEMLCQYS